MKTKHIFVASLDVGEILPFAAKEKKTLKENMDEQERAKKELVKFIDKLEKHYGESIFYMGVDLIEAKNYERFIFEDGGFFELMVGVPLALNAHFVHDKQAKKFCEALKKTLRSILKKSSVSDMFISSIEVNSEDDQSLKYDSWDKVKGIKGGKA
jgi:hypothetical protein